MVSSAMAERREWTTVYIYEKLISLYELVANIFSPFIMKRYFICCFHFFLSPVFTNTNMPWRTHECSIRLVCAPARRRRRESNKKKSNWTNAICIALDIYSDVRVVRRSGAVLCYYYSLLFCPASFSLSYYSVSVYNVQSFWKLRIQHNK